MQGRLEVKSRIAGLVVLGVLVAVFAIAMLAVVASAKHHAGGLTAFVVILVVTYLTLAILAGRRKVILDERGITAHGMFGKRYIAWTELSHYHYYSLGQQGAYIAGGGGGAGVIIALIAVAILRAVRKTPDNRTFSMGSMRVFSKDGTKIKIDVRYKKVADVLDRCFDEMHAVLRDRPRDYAPFTLSATELTHDKKGALALAEIEKIGVSGGRITVRKRGKRLAWAAHAMNRTRNPMLFLDDVAERGLVIDAQNEVFVPLPVLTKLRAATARQAGLPGARIVQR